MVVWVEHDRHERGALWVTSVAINVLDELVADFAISKALTRHLYFNDNPLALQDEVDTRRPAGPAGTRIFGSHVLEDHPQDATD
jgi:hypothetical protein